MRRLLLAAVLAALALPSAALAEPAGQWHLDADSGGSTPDSSGNGLDGATTGIGVINDGRFANAFRFDFGSSVRVGDSAKLETQKLSVVAWVRYGGAGAIPSKYVVAKGGDPGCTNSSYALGTGPGGGLVFSVRMSAGTSAFVSPQVAPGAIWDGDWHAVAGTYDGARVRLYVDGAQIGSGTAAATTIPYGRPDDTLAIGTYPQCAGSGYDFPGDVDEVRVYGRAISAAEVQVLHDPAATTPPVLPPPGAPVPPVTAPPRNVSLPTITGGVRRLYTCNPGTWTGNPTAFSYRWYRAYSFAPDPRVATTQGYTVPIEHMGFTFYCVVTARNRGGSATATSDWTLLSGLPEVPPIQPGPPYGNVAIRGIDVFQTVQPSSGAQMYGFPSGAFPSLPGSGTPVTSPPSRRAAYAGVSLDRDKPATAVVYVSMLASAAAQPAQKLELTLTYLVGGKTVASQTRTITNPPVANTSAVTAAERDDPASGVQFDIPLAVLYQAEDGEFDVRADVALPYGDLARGRRQCNAACDEDDRFRLSGVPVFRLPAVTIFSVELRGQGQALGSLTPADTVLKRAYQLWPGGERMLALTVGHLDVGFEQNLSFADHECTDFKFNTVRACRQYYIGDRVARWKYDDLPSKLGPYQVLFGVMNDPSNPGWKSASTTTLAGFDPKTSVAPTFFADDGTQRRPITAAAHELGHVFGAPHAGTDPTCGGASNGQVGEAWTPDTRGRLQGVIWDRTAKTGGKVDPVVDTTATPRYDLMSYCASTDDSDSWLSARNWNRAFQAMLDLGPRLKADAGARVSLAAPDRAFATGVIGAAGGSITEVVPPDGADRVPVSVAASPVRVRSFDASGRLLLDAGAEVLGSSEDRSGGSFVAPVARAAASVALVRGGLVLDTARRSGTPRVRLRSVRGHRGLVVRWSASDPDGDPLHATVEYAPDGRTWTTVFDGPSRGRAALDARELAGGTRARVRVNVSDSFSEARAVSRRLRVRGNRPRVKILDPGPVAAGERIRLAGQAVDDRHVPLRGRALTWFAGHRRLGTGESVRARLAAGRVTLRLVARDPRGRRAVATRRIRVAPPRLRLETLTAPRRVKRGARTIALRVKTSIAATLRAGGRRHRVGPRARRIVVRLPRRPAVGLLRVPVTLRARGGRIATELTVVRG